MPDKDSPILFSSRTEGYEWLSNMYLLTVPIHGFPSSEHYYQGSKTLDPEWREKIRSASTAYEAKNLGGVVQLRDDWESIHIEIMEYAIEQKFLLNKSLGKKLLATDERELIHYCPWGDDYWGVNKKMEGENHQGLITMQTRRNMLDAQKTCNEVLLCKI